MKIINKKSYKNSIAYETLMPGDLFESVKENGVWLKLNLPVRDSVDLTDGLVGIFDPDDRVILLEGELSVWRKS